MAIISSKQINVNNNDNFSNAYAFKQEVEFISSNQNANTSRIKITYSAYGRYSSYSGFTSPKAEIDLYDDLNGLFIDKVTNKTVSSIAKSVWTEIASWEGDVGHSNEGKIKIQARCIFTTGSTGYLPKSNTITSDLLTLADIPRATENTKTTYYFGNNSVTANSVVSTFKHKIKLTFGTWTYTTSDFFSKTVNVTIPNEVAQQFPNSSSLAGTTILYTYDGGGTLIGQKTNSSVNLVLTTSNSSPVISNVAMIDYNQDIITVTGSSDTIVKHLSTAKVTASGYAPFYGTITGIKINGNSEGFTKDGSNFSITYFEPTIPKDDYTMEVTSSRNTTKSIVISAREFIEYFKPYINAQFKRLGQTTGQIGVSFNGKFYNGSFGTSSTFSNIITIEYRVKQGENISAWTTIDWTENEDGTFNTALEWQPLLNPLTVARTQAFDYESQYTFEMKVTDAFGSSSSGSIIVPRGISIVDYYPDKVEFNVPVSTTNNLITVRPSVSRNITLGSAWSNNLLTLDDVAYRFGDGFQLSSDNKAIIIGKNIKRIKVEGKVLVSPNPGTIYIRIFHGGTTNQFHGYIIGEGSLFFSELIDVVEGDLISLDISPSGANLTIGVTGRYRYTYMNIEQVG